MQLSGMQIRLAMSAEKEEREFQWSGQMVGLGRLLGGVQVGGEGARF